MRAAATELKNNFCVSSSLHFLSVWTAFSAIGLFFLSQKEAPWLDVKYFSLTEFKVVGNGVYFPLLRI